MKEAAKPDLVKGFLKTPSFDPGAQLQWKIDIPVGGIVNPRRIPRQSAG